MPLDQVNIPESRRTKNLRAALKVITPVDKWTTGVRHDAKTGQRCALGGLDAVMGVFATDQSAEVALLAHHAKYKDARTLDPNWGHAHAVALHNNNLGHAATLEMFEAAIAESVELDAIAAMA